MRCCLRRPWAGHMVSRTNRELSAEDIGRIADTYHAWRGEDADLKPYGDVPGFPYEDVPGLCAAAGPSGPTKENPDGPTAHHAARRPGRLVFAVAQNGPTGGPKAGRGPWALIHQRP
jgi:hypothetical protein